MAVNAGKGERAEKDFVRMLRPDRGWRAVRNWRVLHVALGEAHGGSLKFAGISCITVVVLFPV
jgi:hypothetical protein